MVVILPVCRKDADAALRNLAWLTELNPTASPLTCFVSHESGLSEAAAIVGAARRCFADVREIIYAPYHGPAQWPRPQNYAFRAAASYMATRGQGKPWLWWEQDSVPLKADAFERIATEYEACAKPFMGALGASDQPNVSHLNGVAVYPSDACRRVPSLLANGALPFDVAGGSKVLSQSHLTALIQHVWSWEGPRGASPTFPNSSSLEMISDKADLFHRCKDGSLIEKLRTNLTHSHIAPSTSPAAGVSGLVSIVITNFKRPQFLWGAFQSCLAARMTNIVISSSGADPSIEAVHRRISECLPCTLIISERIDSGSNQNWLRGVQAAGTPWVTILHDDDRLLPDYATGLEHLDKADFVCCDGTQHSSADGGLVNSELVRSFPDLESGWHTSKELMPRLLNRRLSLSPVAGCFRRKHVIETLESCRSLGREFFYGNLLVGNDFLLWLRASKNDSSWYYNARPLISYGNHAGSATNRSVTSKDGQLASIYQRIKARFLKGDYP